MTVHQLRCNRELRSAGRMLARYLLPAVTSTPNDSLAIAPATMELDHSGSVLDLQSSDW